MTAAFRIDGDEVGSDAFYAAACDPQRSVVIEACAGAGKTWMLVSRILRALLDGVAPEQILAITFTRKAAGEMKARLDEWLWTYSAAHSSVTQRVQALCERGLDEAAAARLEPALAELRLRLQRGTRGVEVHTFHAWFAQLAGQLPLQLRAQLGLPAQPTLVEDTSPLHDELFRRFQRRVHADPALRADHDALIHTHRRSAVQNWLETAWARADELELADQAGVLEGSMPTAAALDSRCAGLEHPLQLLLQDSLPADMSQLAQQLAAHKGAKARAAGATLAHATQALQLGRLQDGFDQAWDALHTQAGEPRKGLPESSLLTDLSDRLQSLQALNRQQQAHDDHRRMVRLSRVLRDEYRQLKLGQGLVDMPDLERAALALLSDPETADWVQARLDLRIRQVLIDEFQDTSPLQWHALFGWLSAYAGAGGGASGQRPPGVFVVGDPKQSIYRFRRAEPRVFEAARDFVVQGLGGQVLTCDHTRRNAPAVVAALNAVCADALQADGWGPFRPHTTESAEAGEVWALPGVHRPVKATSAEAPRRWRDTLTEARHEPNEHLKLVEARQVAAALAEAVHRDGLDPGQVMVLARQRAMLRRVAEALAAQGLPYVMPEGLSLADEPEAQDLIALLDVLASPGHDLSLARALRSPLFDCSDDDLLRLAQAAQGQRRPWLDVVTMPAAGGRSPALDRAGRLLAAWRALVHQLTPHELLDRVLHEADLQARLLASTPAPRRVVALQVLRGLLQAALDHEGGRFVSTYRFVRALKQGHLEASPRVPAGAVQLLTVHGAKGLEADVVFIVDTAPERRQGERSTLLVDWPVEAAAPRCAAFVISESRMPAALATLQQREQAAREREEINGLYVALTRARRRLVVSHTQPHAPSLTRSWWQRLQPVVQSAPAVPAPETRMQTGPAVPATFDRLPRLPAASGSDVPSPAPQLAADSQAAALGRAVHRLLEWIGQPGQPLPRSGRAAAARQAAAAFGLPVEAAVEVAAWAATIADSPACAPFFGGAGLRWCGNEVPVVNDGQVLRIDRLVQLDDGGQGQWWVLDYKLRQRPEQLAEYRHQLEQYRQALQTTLQTQGEADPVVRAAFITGAGELVEP